MQIEFAFFNALFQETGEDFLPGTKAFVHDGTTKPEIRFKNLMTARSPVDDVGACAVLSHDRPQDSFCGRPFLRRGRLSKVPSVRVESLEPSNKQVFLSLPIEVDSGARQSSFFCDIIDRGSAITEITEPPYGRPENFLSRVL